MTDTTTRLRKGTRLRVTRTGTHGFAVGDVGAVVEVHDAEPAYKISTDPAITSGWRSGVFAWVREGEYEVLSDTPSVTNPKKGDRLKVTDERDPKRHYTSIGDLTTDGTPPRGAVVTVREDGLDFDGDVSVQYEDSTHLWVRPEDVTPYVEGEEESASETASDTIEVGDRVKVLRDGEWTADSPESYALYYSAFVPGMEAEVIATNTPSFVRYEGSLEVRFPDGVTKYVTRAQVEKVTEPTGLPEGYVPSEGDVLEVTADEPHYRTGDGNTLAVSGVEKGSQLQVSRDGFDPVGDIRTAGGSKYISPECVRLAATGVQTTDPRVAELEEQVATLTEERDLVQQALDAFRTKVRDVVIREVDDADDADVVLVALGLPTRYGNLPRTQGSVVTVTTGGIAIRHDDDFAPWRVYPDSVAHDGRWCSDAEVADIYGSTLHDAEH